MNMLYCDWNYHSVTKVMKFKSNVDSNNIRQQGSGICELHFPITSCILVWKTNKCWVSVNFITLSLQ